MFVISCLNWMVGVRWRGAWRCGTGSGTAFVVVCCFWWCLLGTCCVGVSVHRCVYLSGSGRPCWGSAPSGVPCGVWCSPWRHGVRCGFGVIVCRMWCGGLLAGADFPVSDLDAADGCSLVLGRVL